VQLSEGLRLEEPDLVVPWGLTVREAVAFRLAQMTSVKHGQSGRGWTGRYNYAWLTSLGLYRLTGTIRYRQAHATR
jgi:hypothetical protein